MKQEGITNEQLTWYILDEAAVACSAKHVGSGYRPCPICDKIVEAMKLLPHPTSEQCQILFEVRKR